MLALTVTIIAAPLEANHDSSSVNLTSDSSNRKTAEEAALMAKREGDEGKEVHGVLSFIPTFLLHGIKIIEPAHS